MTAKREIWDTVELFSKKWIAGGTDERDIPDKSVVIPMSEGLSEVFTKERIRLLRRIWLDRPKTIRELAKSLKRDPAAVTRDIEILAKYDLITVERQGRTARPIAKRQIIVLPVLSMKQPIMG
ncbi:MAG: helix-turn-helix domain-containing protein [Candidatus Aenigmarchaeota archaeon]|nr:helix-turn-helix domain-containing protein [Candidatus Aenigmarchaeota archaeon]